MKKIIKISSILAVVFMAISCDKDETKSDNLTADDAKTNTQIDIASDDVSNIVDLMYDNINENTISYRTVNESSSVYSNCATITRVPAFGTALTPGTQVTKTIDFGTTGCTLNNGNVVKGKIIINFVFQPNADSHVITYTFDNFYHNGIKLEGTKTFTRSMTVATAAIPSRPIVVMVLDLTITLANGNVVTRVGTRTREFVEGYNTPQIFADNIYKITGNWTTTKSNGNQHTATITEPLMAKMSCAVVNKPILAKGIISFVKNNVTSTLDYGDGTCDNIAIYTINGNSYTIIIGN